MKEKVFNYDFNHNVDVCRINRVLEKTGTRGLMDSNLNLNSIEKLNIFKNFNFEHKDTLNSDNILNGSSIDDNTADHSK